MGVDSDIIILLILLSFGLLERLINLRIIIASIPPRIAEPAATVPVCSFTPQGTQAVQSVAVILSYINGAGGNG